MVSMVLLLKEHGYSDRASGQKPSILFSDSSGKQARFRNPAPKREPEP